jgi:hypothetical protein
MEIIERIEAYIGRLHRRIIVKEKREDEISLFIYFMSDFLQDIA